MRRRIGRSRLAGSIVSTGTSTSQPRIVSRMPRAAADTHEGGPRVFRDHLLCSRTNAFTRSASSARIGASRRCSSIIGRSMPNARPRIRFDRRAQPLDRRGHAFDDLADLAHQRWHAQPDRERDQCEHGKRENEDRDATRHPPPLQRVHRRIQDVGQHQCDDEGREHAAERFEQPEEQDERRGEQHQEHGPLARVRSAEHEQHQEQHDRREHRQSPCRGTARMRRAAHRCRERACRSRRCRRTAPSSCRVRSQGRSGFETQTAPGLAHDFARIVVGDRSTAWRRAARCIR